MREKVKLTANILFSGIGCQERGFENSGLFDLEVLNTSDINKESVLSYAAIHCGMTNEMVDEYEEYPSREDMAQHLTDINLGYEPEKNKYFDWFKLAKRKNNELNKYWLACKLTHNKGDISKITELPYADFWTCSFPCTDISVAGKMKGLNPDSGTRSSLLWENIKLLNRAKDNGTLPKYIMVENVKNLVSKSFIEQFNDLINIFEELGFNTYWKVINGKDCGVPQNRERVFIICIRKDIDTKLFNFPVPFDNGIRLKDILEDKVDEKYYISNDKVEKFLSNMHMNTEHIDNSPVRLGNVYGEQFGTGYTGNVWDKDAISPTIMTAQGGGRQPHIIDDEIHGIDKSYNNPKIIDRANCITAREDQGVSNHKSEGTAILEMPDVSYCLDANYYKGTTIEQYIKKHRRQLIPNDIRIRKLTPRECFRLMGLTFNDCDKAYAIGVANSHLYKQAGNGIITDCCELLAEHLYKAQYDNTYECRDENFTRPQVV